MMERFKAQRIALREIAVVRGRATRERCCFLLLFLHAHIMNAGKTGLVSKETVLLEKLFASGHQLVFLFTFPHVPQNLNVTRDLFFRTFYPCVFEVIDKKLVPPSAATPGIGSPRRLPVLPKPFDENFLNALRPDLTGTVLEHFSVFSLRSEGPLARWRRRSPCISPGRLWRWRHGHEKGVLGRKWRWKWRETERSARKRR